MQIRVTVGPGVNAEKPLIQPPVIHHVKDFNEDSGRLFYETLNKALLAGQSFLPMAIDSYGGNAHGLLSLIDAMRSSSIPVATVIQGKAMSCGAMLAALGERGMRFIGPQSHIMVHHVASFMGGILPQIKADLAHGEDLERQIFELMDEHCGHKPGFFRDKLKPREGADWYIKPHEAVGLGLVDHVRIPRFDVHVSAAMTLD